MAGSGTRFRGEYLDLGGNSLTPRGNAVLQWDLSDSVLARTDQPIRAPTEEELYVVLVALLLNENIAYSDLATRGLALTEYNRDAIAQTIEWRLGGLARDIGHGAQLRRRLSELEGLSVMCVPVKA